MANRTQIVAANASLGAALGLGIIGLLAIAIQGVTAPDRLLRTGGLWAGLVAAVLLAVSFLLRAALTRGWLRYRYLGVSATACALATVLYVRDVVGIGPTGVGLAGVIGALVVLLAALVSWDDLTNRKSA
jgi:hypothetical protein